MPRPERALRLTETVPFLFGMADRDRLPGVALVRLLSDLGATDSAARSTVARMREEGALQSFPRGRTTQYALAGIVESAFLRARAVGQADTIERPWTGAFHGLLTTVPEDARAFRDRLRHAARLAGYAPLRSGLMISATDGWSELAEVVAGRPSGASVYPLTLRLSADDSRAAATQAWHLAEVAANTEGLARRLRREADRDQAASGASALSAYVRLALPAYRFFVGIPALPSELLPIDWPMPQLVEALARVTAAYGPPAQRHLESVIADSA